MPRRVGEICSRPTCGFAVQNRGLCKKHYPIAYPAHLRGDVDATRARHHIAALRGRGMTVKSLRLQYGISDIVIRHVQSSPSKIRKLTEIKILEIPLPTVWMPTLVDVDATGTRRRLQALGALGHRQEDIGARIGMPQRRIGALMGFPFVSSATAAKVERVYKELQMVPGTSDVSRRRAKKRGWVPPFGWDEESIDDPAGRPWSGTAPRTTTTERIAELRELGVYDLPAIAQRLGITIKSLERQLQRDRVAS